MDFFSSFGHFAESFQMEFRELEARELIDLNVTLAVTYHKSAIYVYDLLFHWNDIECIPFVILFLPTEWNEKPIRYSCTWSAEALKRN